MKYVGVDGCPDGWLAVEYEEATFCAAEQYDDIEAIWDAHDDAELVLIDVPIGLRETDNTPRPCDAAARRVLGSPRSSSVFPTPVRGVLEADSYEEARRIQEDKTGGSLGAQTWGISNKIRELDKFMLSNQSEVKGTICEAHPEVCFWALNDQQSTRYSKTGMPVAAFWERVEILERIDETIIDDIRSAGTDLRSKAKNDDLLDAFALAITGSPLTDPVKPLPRDPPENDDGDPKGLPMEMAYAKFSK